MTDELCINTIRCLAADVVEKAKSGHPGMPMGMAPIAHLVWGKHARFDPHNPKWLNHDRIILSNGHGCALQYIMLHLTGYDLSMDDLKKFRQLHSKTPGHPESFMTPGIDVTTGPLGQGIANAVGVAIAGAHLGARFNKPSFTLFDSYVYVFCGDGCQMEGVALEAMSVAGHLGLGKIIMLYDDNHITIDGDTELAFTEDVNARAAALGWHVATVENGDTDVAAIDAAIEAAKSVTDKPSIIKVRTTIGYGSRLAGKEKSHGAPLGADNVAALKEHFHFDPTKSFYVPDEVYAHYRNGDRNLSQQWNNLFAEYKVQYPELAAELEDILSFKKPENWKDHLPKFGPSTGIQATRKSSEIVLNGLAPMFHGLIGGSADLTGSNLTYVKGAKDFQKESPDGRYIRFGVREHSMAAICNGIVYYGANLIPYCGTFLVFLGYALGAIRLSALSHLGVIYVATHDSIGLGEDGPTHQPVETLCTLRSLPNMNVMRPADGTETAGCYAVAIELRTTPSVLALSRHELPQLPGSSLEKVAHGAYVIHDVEQGQHIDAIIVATGSEVAVAIDAANKQKALGKNVRVVSMPSTFLYDAQSSEYKRSLFPAGVPVVSLEASVIYGWERYSHVQLGMTSFGASGPLKEVLADFGFTGDKVSAKLTRIMEFYHNKPIPDLLDKPDLS